MAHVTRREAESLLADADRAGQVVQRRAPKEHLPFYLWGLFHLLVIPGFDVVDPEIWGPVTLAVASVGCVGTYFYFARGSDRVLVRERSPWWAWPTLAAFSGLIAALTVGVGEQIRLPYTLAGLVIAVPMFAWATQLRRKA
jgi:hypothetical protein